MVAGTQGTAVAVPGCGPLPLGLPFANVPAFPQAIQAGWAFVATDYAWMAAPGVAPYLVGLGEARSTLDALRAARQVRGLALADATVVWGAFAGRARSAVDRGGVAARCAGAAPARDRGRGAGDRPAGAAVAHRQ